MNFNVYPVIDKRGKCKNNKYPIKIAIGRNRKVEYVHTGLYASKSDWDLLNSLKVPNHLSEVNTAIKSIQNTIQAALTKVVPYNIKLIRLHVSGKDIGTPAEISSPAIVSSNVLDWFDLKMKELTEKEAYGTARSYKDTKSFYKRITGLEFIPFSYFTMARLYQIQKEAVTNENMSAGNVFRHARQLRAIFNIAILEKAIDKSVYPFHKRGYRIHQTRKLKKALSPLQISKVLSFTPRSPDERLALDYFTFAYFGNGMNMKDISYLRYSNIQGNKIRFIRQKTKNTTTEPKLITVAITEEMKAVITRQGSKSAKNGFVFPILNDRMQPTQQHNAYRRMNCHVNKHLKAICDHLELSITVTHGMSRYTFANALKQQGVPIDYISEAMGHSSTSVTEHYLNSFEDNVVNQHAEKLRQYSTVPEEIVNTTKTTKQ